MVVCWSERIRANIVLVLVLEIRGINRALLGWVGNKFEEWEGLAIEKVCPN